MAKSSKSVPPLTIKVPTPEEDHPAWSKVAVIAVIGFVVGVAWPRIAGVKLGPNAPNSGSTEPAASAAAAAVAAPESPVASAPSGTAAPVNATQPSRSASSFAVARGQVLACRDADGEQKKGSDCGQLIGIDAIVLPRIRKLSSCAATAGAMGKLSVVASLDFGGDRLLVNAGKSSTVQDVAAFEVCLKSQFQGVSINSVNHEMPKYTMVFPVTFGAPAAPTEAENPTAANTPAPQTGASGATPLPSTPNSGEVVWSTALVRDTPRSGQIVARLVRGTAVKVGPPNLGWYPIRFGSGFSTEGWVYREAIGK